MLQNVLQSLTPVLQNTIMAVIPLAMLMALAAMSKSENLKKNVLQAVIWGLIGASFFVVLKTGTRAVKREVYELLVLAVGAAAELLLVFLLGLNYRRLGEEAKRRLPGPLVFIISITLVLYHGFEFLLYPLGLAINADELVNIGMLFKGIGIVLAIIITWVTGVAVYRSAIALSPKALWFVSITQFGAVILLQAVVIVQNMMLSKLLPINRQLLAIMAPLINNQIWFLYSLLAVTLVLPAALLFKRRPEKPEGSNPAEYRKLLKEAKRRKNWGAAVGGSLLVIVLSTGAGIMYANQTEELVPAVAVFADDGFVRLPLENVEDGHLHRFVFSASNGSGVRFIAIKKGGSAYGIGLDACEICGPTGYYERDGQVVCKLCDVVMNKATIGFKGGCNPIPLEYKIGEGKILIPLEALEQEKDRFR